MWCDLLIVTQFLEFHLFLYFSVEDILQSLRVGINEEVIRFKLNRRNVWDGAVRAMRRPNFSTNKRVDVKFTDDAGVSEGAVDLGGPMREFFRLVLQHIRNSPMFDGPENQHTLSCHAECKCINQFHFMCWKINYKNPVVDMVCQMFTVCIFQKRTEGRVMTLDAIVSLEPRMMQSKCN